MVLTNWLFVNKPIKINKKTLFNLCVCLCLCVGMCMSVQVPAEARESVRSNALQEYQEILIIEPVQDSLW